MIRLNYIDQLRGIGILLVVLGHSYRQNFNYGEYETLANLDWFIYTFHMPLFFFISGLVLKPKFSDKLKNKVKSVVLTSFSLLIPTILWMSIQLVFNLSLEGGLNNYFSLFITSLIRPFQQFWFMYALIISLGIATIVIRKGEKENFLILLINFPILLFLGERGALATIYSALYFIYLGYYVQSLTVRSRYIFAATSLLLFLISYPFLGLDSFFWKIAIIMLIYISFISIDTKIMPLEILGKFSIHIYFLHVIIRDFLFQIYPFDISYFIVLSTVLCLYLPIFIGKKLPSYLFRVKLNERIVSSK